MVHAVRRHRQDARALRQSGPAVAGGLDRRRRALSRPAPRRVVMERNPYFWAVDAEGNQLPYIDRVVGQIYADTEALVLAPSAATSISGSARSTARRTGRSWPANREKGDYQLFETPSIGGSPVVFYLNLTHKDRRVSRAVQQDATSASPCRWGSIGRRSSTRSCSGSASRGRTRRSRMRHVPRALCEQYLEYDPAEANRLLDALGLDDRGARRHPPAAQRPSADHPSRHLAGPADRARCARDHGGAMARDRGRARGRPSWTGR